ncbi:MAG: hypothetical protein ACHQ50_09960 [Fimbriimonadales bacterium]
MDRDQSRRRYLRLDLHGESIVLDVPYVPPSKAVREDGYDPVTGMFGPCKGYPVNMIWDPGTIKPPKRN